MANNREDSVVRFFWSLQWQAVRFPSSAAHGERAVAVYQRNIACYLICPLSAHKLLTFVISSLFHYRFFIIDLFEIISIIRRGTIE